MTVGCTTLFVACWTRSNGAVVTYKARTEYEAWSAILSLAAHDETEQEF